MKITFFGENSVVIESLYLDKERKVRDVAKSFIAEHKEVRFFTTTHLHRIPKKWRKKL